ncbi:MAG TPA: hypothetical protein ENH44_00655 [Actinobacteria bacterium]|nr:hypothetical protein [Actinomycetota bacterium]
MDFYLGVSEPGSDELVEMAREADRLAADHINAVGVLPPILITQRAGGKPRVILEGAAASITAAIEDLHHAGLAVHLAPTTDSPGFSLQVEPTDNTLEHLKEDVLKWADTAEEQQVELFSPLDRYNMVLGTEAANRWSREVLPRVREDFGGELVASVVPDLDGPPAPGSPHDFEKLDFSGYDYLMIQIFPQGEEYDSQTFQGYVDELLQRAGEVANRYSLKGVMVSFGGWRQPAGMAMVDGPLLGNEGQAAAATIVLSAALPHSSGVFFYGWTLPGRGARDFPVEDTLKKLYGQISGG